MANAACHLDESQDQKMQKSIRQLADKNQNVM